MDQTTYRPMLSITPLNPTSTPQAVFCIRLPSILLATNKRVPLPWPTGATIKHTLNDVTETFNIPDDQGSTPVYLVYHNLEDGLHTWSAVIKGEGLTDTQLGPFDWEVELTEDQRADYAAAHEANLLSTQILTEENTIEEV